MKKDILSLQDLQKEDFINLFERAIELKARYKRGICDRTLLGKTLGLLFEKKSTRTRVAFETAIIQLGGTPIFMAVQDTQIARNEPIKDTARVLSRFVDALAIRTFSQEKIEQFAKSSTIPVINALTDLYHPCQILSDIMTIIEYKKSFDNIKIVWVGDGNNVCHSWINAAAILDMNFVIASPKGYSPDSEILNNVLTVYNKQIMVTDNAVKAVQDADVIYTDVWASMGQENEQTDHIEQFNGFQINNELIGHAKKDVIIMHCLPAHRGEEITDDVLEGENSVVWDQAENKMHMHKAILEKLILG